MVNILVVEDDQSVASALRATLETEGYQVTTVLNGKDAVQFALREMPQLIILDIQLSRVGVDETSSLDGYQVMSQSAQSSKEHAHSRYCLEFFG